MISKFPFLTKCKQIEKAKKTKRKIGVKARRLCTHDNWVIYGDERMGYASCLDCKARVCLSDLINRKIILLEAQEKLVNIKKEECRKVAIRCEQVLKKLERKKKNKK